MSELIGQTQNGARVMAVREGDDGLFVKLGSLDADWQKAPAPLLREYDALKAGLASAADTDAAVAAAADEAPGDPSGAGKKKPIAPAATGKSPAAPAIPEAPKLKDTAS